MTLFTETVTLIKRGEKIGEDKYGRPEYGPPTRVDSPAWFERAGANEEDTRGREQYVTGYTLYLPVAADLRGSDAVALPGVPGEFQVDGEVGYQPAGFVVEGYQVAALQRVEG